MVLQFYFLGFLGMSIVLGLTTCFRGPQARAVGKLASIPFIVLFLLMTVNREIFSDSQFYLSVFNSTEKLKTFGFERGFELYTIVLSTVANWPIYLLSFPMLLLAGGLRLYKNIRQTPSYWIAVFLMLSWPFFWAYSMTGARQSLAIAMGFFAFSELAKKRVFTTLAFFILAVQFHGSALVLMVAMIAVKFRKSTKFFLTIWVGSIFAAIVLPLDPIIGLVVSGSSLSNDFGHYFNGTFGSGYEAGLRPSFLVLSSVPMVAYWFRRPKSFTHEERFRTIFHSYLLLNAVGNAASTIPYADRVYAYSWLLVPVLLASIWEETPQAFRFAVAGLLVLLSATYSVYWLGF